MASWMRLALLGAVLAASTAQGASVLRLEPGAMAAQSELIFIGTVTGQRSVLEQGPTAGQTAGRSVQIFTDTMFRVDQVVKGIKQDTFMLRQLGGVVGEGAAQMGTAVPGYARFTPGERVVLFLERTDTGRLVVTGLAQGKYTLETDAKTGTVMAVRTMDGLHMVGRAPDKVFAGVPADLNRMPLDTLLAMVAGRRPAPLAPPAAAPQVVRTPQLSLPGGDR